jgi:hypothetical protein
MKTRGAAQSRSAGHRLNMLREFLIGAIIYLGLPAICATPLLLLYWLHRPTVLTNPGITALKEPVPIVSLPPAIRPEYRTEIGTSGQAPLHADSRKLHQGPEGSRPIAGRRNLRFAGGVRGPAPAYKTGASFSNPAQHTGVSRSAASAYAYAVDHSGQHERSPW